MAVDLKSLVSKLNAPCRKALEDAAGLTMSRTHYNVEIEHWLLKLIEIRDGDIGKILSRYEADLGRLTGELTRAIERFKTGNGRPPGLAPQVVKLASDAWLWASVNRQAHEVRSGHLLVAILSDEAMGIAARNASAQLAKIPVETLSRDFEPATDGSSEAKAAAAVEDVQAGAGAAGAAPRRGQSGALDLYTTDLTARAKAGKLDPILGRDPEIRQCIDILLRRRQNNPILTGEAGVGKTAVVDGLALKIAADDVPDKLKGCAIKVLDLGLLQAGAGMKGEFENRLNGVLQDVKASPQPIIMFIDEAHMMIGAGGQAGQGDAANLLKPALARGELRTIAATTWAEYKKYFERDPALTRRFQVVKVEEPDERNGIEMLRAVAVVMEQHHKVRVLDEAVQEAVRLSNRYIAGRQLPDKAISVLDTACARVAMAQTSTPADVEDLRRRIELLDVRLGVLRREQQAGTDHSEDIAEGDLEAVKLREEMTALEERWAKEKVLVDEVTKLRADLEGELNDEERPGKKAALDARWAELKALQGEAPLVMPLVDGQAAAAIVADWTGIPVGRMLGDQIRTVLGLKDKMAERVIGQDHALELIAKGMRTARARMQDPRKPLGVFMLAGTSGTGKTETALTLAEQMYGGDQALTIINMSEFKEEHKVSMLVGSPPGYVGYGEGGVLTEAVRRHPYSVVLLDEVEKAHPGVQDVFYQVFDKGMLRDGEGRDIDFKNCVIILTSNAGTDLISKLCADPDTRPNPDALNEALHPELLKTFKPAFLGRITVVPYYPLDEPTIKKIVRLQLSRVVKRVGENYKAPMTYADEMVDTIASRCTEVASGARNIEQIIQRTILPELSSSFLGALADGKVIHKVHVGVDKEGHFEYTIE